MVFSNFLYMSQICLVSGFSASEKERGSSEYIICEPKAKFTKAMRSFSWSVREQLVLRIKIMISVKVSELILIVKSLLVEW